jgi:hypothetical protein
MPSLRQLYSPSNLDFFRQDAQPLTDINSIMHAIYTCRAGMRPITLSHSC